MSANLDPRYERLMDLLADQALFGLNESESDELEMLLKEFPNVKGDEFELTAASILLAAQSKSSASDERLPDELRQRLADQRKYETAHQERSNGKVAHRADTISNNSRLSNLIANDSLQVGATRMESRVNTEEQVERANQAVRNPKNGSPRTERAREVIAWLIAAAAMIIAFAAWFDRGQADSDTITPQPVSLAELRQSLIDSREDTHILNWSINDAKFLVNEGESFQGDVVWSDEAQEGFMTFNGLIANNDSDECYQLWIFDKERDERHPVDGGTFQIRNDGKETVVPINAKLSVNESTMFAITVERGSGVVVSDRSRLPLLAQVASANQ